MASPPSNSDGTVGGPSGASAFEQLHRGVQEWVWEQNWTTLREAQERAIPILLAGQQDLIIAASTAAGKTEAAFLPIVSRIADDTAPGVKALYVSPLKALINDQFRRLESLCERLNIPVHRWHGDVPANRKLSVLEKPSGILLITPESMEGLFVRQGPRLKQVFSSLQYVVIDELHAFIGSERGRQLQSQLHRLELLLRRRVTRVGLSATLGDMQLACNALRSGEQQSVALMEAKSGERELLLQVRGYIEREPPPGGTQTGPTAAGVAEALGQPDSEGGLAIARHLFNTLRGSHNLVFANSRRLVEEYGDRLRRLCEEERVPNEFVVHHGSLSREIREDTEDQLKQREKPVTAVCTSTLELGIDIGSVRSVAQIGPPNSVAALRQRLGRSGRRPGEPAILRIYVTEAEIGTNSDLLDELRVDLVQTVAAINLLLAGWCEPPDAVGCGYSTLVQQVLSLVAQFGGVSAQDAYLALCHKGPFSTVGGKDFAHLLRNLGQCGLLRQEGDGTLLLDTKGEAIVGHFSFYAAFQSPEEFRVVCGSTHIGTVAIDPSSVPGGYMILGARRWRVLAVDPDGKEVAVEPARGGRVPRFEQTRFARVHDRVRLEMRRVWAAGDMPSYLDSTAQGLLTEARHAFVRHGLHDSQVVPQGSKSTLVFACRGARIMHSLAMQLTAMGCTLDLIGPAILIADADPTRVHGLLQELKAARVEDAECALSKVAAMLFRQEKFDWAVPDDLLIREFAAKTCDFVGAHEAVGQLSSWQARGGA